MCLFNFAHIFLLFSLYSSIHFILPYLIQIFSAFLTHFRYVGSLTRPFALSHWWNFNDKNFSTECLTTGVRGVSVTLTRISVCSSTFFAQQWKLAQAMDDDKHIFSRIIAFAKLGHHFPRTFTWLWIPCELWLLNGIQAQRRNVSKS